MVFIGRVFRFDVQKINQEGIFILFMRTKGNLFESDLDKLNVSVLNVYGALNQKNANC
jgi:hypothetical protein